MENVQFHIGTQDKNRTVLSTTQSQLHFTVLFVYNFVLSFKSYIIFKIQNRDSNPVSVELSKSVELLKPIS